MNAGRVIHLRSAAKINVFLEVHGRREDGFHELETIMLRTSLCDRIRFQETPTDGISLQLDPYSSSSVVQSFPLNDSNLIVKAAAALQDFASVDRGAQITVSKSIPAEAGLAGGSSNAATTLIGLNALWDLNLPTAVLHEIAATLGSDVNFFIEECRAAVCRGRGEFVTPVDVRGPFYAVVARPQAGNSTPQVFAGVSMDENLRRCEPVLGALLSGSVSELTGSVFNRLTTAARQLNPQMCSLMEEMEARCGRPVFMSGSGSTVYVIARSYRDSQRLLASLCGLDCVFRSAVRIAAP